MATIILLILEGEHDVVYLLFYQCFIPHKLRCTTSSYFIGSTIVIVHNPKNKWPRHLGGNHHCNKSWPHLYPTTKGKVWDIGDVQRGILCRLSTVMLTTLSCDRLLLKLDAVQHTGQRGGLRRGGRIRSTLPDVRRHHQRRLQTEHFAQVLRICLRFSPRPEHPGSGSQLVPPTNIECVEF